MNVLDIAIILFISLETSNVLALYFKPELKQANAMGAFKSWPVSESNIEMYNLTNYLVSWVAGSKLIFILLLLVILFFADLETKIYSTYVLVLAIASFYWKLYPLVRRMDLNGEIRPKGYSRTLGMMIAVFMVVLLLSAVYMHLSIT